MAIDKRESFVKITGGVVPWMLTFIERMVQSYLVDFAIKELETQLKTSWQDDLNQIALEYLQTVYLSNKLGFDFSLTESPSDVNDTFMVDLNGTFMHEDPKTREQVYAQHLSGRFSDDEIRSKMDMDFVAVVKAELFNSFLDVWYDTNTTISIKDALATFAPGMQLTCDSAIGIRLPNMRFDKFCADGPHKQPYPLDV